MAEPLRFHPLVADDLQSATDWYDDISVELGSRFRSAVDARLDSVEQVSAFAKPFIEPRMTPMGTDIKNHKNQFQGKSNDSP